MKISKNPIVEIDPYPEDPEWEYFCEAVGALVKKRFTTGYVRCNAENLGWQHRSGYKVFKCDTSKSDFETGRQFVLSFTPNCDWCATVYSLNGGKGLYFSVSHHDAQGESYYLTPISERTYERLS